MTLDYAIEDGQPLSRNSSTRTEFLPLRSTSHTYLTTSEEATLAEACGNQGDVISLLAYAGMRFGEPVGLCVEDVDLRARRITVRRSFTKSAANSLRAASGVPPAGARYPCHSNWSRPNQPGIGAPSVSLRHHLAQRRLARTRESEALPGMARKLPWPSIGRRCRCTLYDTPTRRSHGGPAPFTAIDHSVVG
jgi:integrase